MAQKRNTQPRSNPLQPLFRRPGGQRGLSLAMRIILINAFAMLLMISGLFYFGRYMDRLIDDEVTLLLRQARLVASTLGEVAVDNTEIGDYLRTDITRQMIRRLVESNDARAQVFAPNSLMIADSRLLRGAGKYVQVEVLPPPTGQPQGLRDYVMNAFGWFASLMPYGRNLPVHIESALPSVEQMPDVTKALRGEPSWTLWSTKDQSLMLTAAVPVQRLHQVVGAVVLSRSSNDIANTLHSLRVELLQNFAMMLGVAVVLSLYMAQTIARPLRRLAKAARRSQAITGGLPDIPNYSYRGDEIGELSIALSAMAKALWERLDATERFAADVAHELKNPLSSMKSALETLERVKDDNQRSKLVSILTEDVVRMDRLISDISSASRLEAELSRTTPETFNFVEVLSTLVTSRSQAGSPLDLKVKDSRLMVRGIPGRLVQVIENLIGNALSFSPEKEGVTLRVEGTLDRVILTVDDNGPGVPPGKEQKIFERFYSERPDGEAFGTHSGLGLSISRKIIEGHGGRIYATNRLNADGIVEGARFIVELPRQ